MQENESESLGDAAQALVTEYEAAGVKVDQEVKSQLGCVTVKQLAGVFDMKEMRSNSEKAELLRQWAGSKGDDKKSVVNKKVPTAVMDVVQSAIGKDYIEELQTVTHEISLHQARVEQLAEARAGAKQKRRAARQHQRSQQLYNPTPPHAQISSIPLSSLRFLRHAFHKVARASLHDNDDKDDDFDWWKRPSYRRDFEKNRRNGHLWNAVMEGASLHAEESELVAREEFYKSMLWWQHDKFRREWEVTCDIEWWKTADVHADRQCGGQKWLRDDPAEADRLVREEWFLHSKKPVTRTWAAAVEGDTEECSAEEAAERSDYFLSGAWWTEDSYHELFCLIGCDSAPLRYLHKVELDEDWQEQDVLTSYFEEVAAGTEPKDIPCLAGLCAEGIATRCEWYEEHWWRLPRYAQDYYTNGATGTSWRADDQDSYSMCDYKLQHIRQQWYEAQLREWWQRPYIIDDYFQSLELQREGLYWRSTRIGDVATVSEDEVERRAEWYRAHWWRQSKYTASYHAGGRATHLWKAKEHVTGGEWWKGKGTLKDWTENAENGRKWRAMGPISAANGEMLKHACTKEEAALREDWYLRHTDDGAAPAFAQASEADLEERAAWFHEQISEREKRKRVEWYTDKDAYSISICSDDMTEFLTLINEDSEPSEEQVLNVLGYLKPLHSFSYLQVLGAVLESQFFVPLTRVELLRHYEEEREAQQLQVLMQREEEAVFMTEVHSEGPSPPASPIKHGKGKRDSVHSPAVPAVLHSFP